MDAGRTAWVLNLDADLELGAPSGYAPKQSVRAAMEAFVPRLAASLLGEGDVLVEESSPPGSARGLAGRAFCPTPRADALLRRAGAVPVEHPPVEVLRRVNSRAFAAAVGPMLPRARFATSVEAAAAALREAPPAFALGGAWRVKRAFGMAGRGQRVIAPGLLGEGDDAFVRAGIRDGGLQIEPNVAIATEYGLHGRLAQDGALALGALVEQRCDARGAWLATSRARDGAALDGEAIGDRLAAQARRVAVALAGAGYFGPFGVDAFTYRDELAELHLAVMSEINARYSMGFAVGFASPLRGL